MTDTHILSTGQIESTLAYIEDLETRIDLLEDTPEDQRRAEILVARINDALEALGESIPIKAERSIHVLRAAEATAQRLKAAEDQIKARRARVNRTVERIKRDIAPRLLDAHRQYVADDRANLRTDAGTIYTTRRTKLVVPDDPAQWPAEYVELIPKLDRRALTSAVKANPADAPEGVYLEQTEGVTIR
ncbi:MAG: hypothetical protein CMH39_00415 [Micrococcales bacterium]|jgi:hypothetical protein|nr:hypothetical protein [Micrococcales bacterium]|tara:strand:+ start:351 stop:917 length:567 start_codon:yes stop_codon:yes gene_type:complete